MVVFVHGNTVVCFGEPSETVWETLVAERLASRRTAEVAQQVVRTRPAGVDVEETQPDGDPVAAAGGNKRGRSDHRRQHDDERSGDTTFNTAVLCACTDLQEESAASGSTSSQRLRVRGMETAVQEIWTASSGETPWNAPSPLVVDELSRATAVGPSVEKQKKGLRGTVVRRGV